MREVSLSLHVEMRTHPQNKKRGRALKFLGRNAGPSDQSFAQLSTHLFGRNSGNSNVLQGIGTKESVCERIALHFFGANASILRHNKLISFKGHAPHFHIERRALSKANLLWK